MKRLCALLLAALGAVPAFAQDTPEELARRVRELEEQVRALQGGVPSATVEELRRQIDVLTREIEQLKVGRTEAVADVPQYGLGAAASKVYRSGPGVSFGGYGEAVYENYAEETEAGTASGRKDQLDFLRAILYTGYKFSDTVVFNSELEVEHATTGGAVGEVSLEFAYLDFMLRPELGVRAGMMLMPVGLVNELHEPTAFFGSRRPDLERNVLPSTWREPGVGVFGEVGPLTYRSYVVTGLRSDRFTSSGIRSGRQQGGRALAEDLAWVGRLDWAPREGVLLGGSLYTGGSAQGRTTPDGRAFDARVTIGELHADVRWRGLAVRGLWAAGRVGDATDVNLANGLAGDAGIGSEFGGWYAEAGYDLASLLPLGGQSLVPFVRFESYDTQVDVPAGFADDPRKRVDLLTAGLSWKPIAQTVIKADFQAYDDRAQTGVDQFNLSIGYIF